MPFPSVVLSMPNQTSNRLSGQDKTHVLIRCMELVYVFVIFSSFPYRFLVVPLSCTVPYVTVKSSQQNASLLELTETHVRLEG